MIYLPTSSYRAGRPKVVEQGGTVPGQYMLAYLSLEPSAWVSETGGLEEEEDQREKTTHKHHRSLATSSPVAHFPQSAFQYQAEANPSSGTFH